MCRQCSSHVIINCALLRACTCALVTSSETVSSTASTVSGAVAVHRIFRRWPRTQSRAVLTSLVSGNDFAQPTARRDDSLTFGTS